MTTDIIELADRVFEVTTTPGDEVPGVCRRTCTIRLLSGPPLTDEDFARIKQTVVRDLIDLGLRVYGMRPGDAEDAT